jgi:hypothetical protein
VSGQTVGWVLAHSKSRGTARMVLTVIAEAAHADGSGAYPSLDTIAERSGCTRSNVPRAIARLEALGELRVDRATDGQHSNRYTVLGLPGQQLSLMPADDSGGVIKTAEGWSHHATGVLSKRPLGGGVVIPEPSTPSSNLTEPGAARAQRVPRFEKVPTVAEEAKMVLAEAEATWLAGHSRVGTDRYTDRAALRNLRTATKRALGHDDALDVLAGIRAHATDPEASPWYVDRWAGEARAQRQERERTARVHREREEEMRLHTAQVEAEQADPVMRERVRDLLRDTARKLGMGGTPA